VNYLIIQMMEVAGYESLLKQDGMWWTISLISTFTTSPVPDVIWKSNRWAGDRFLVDFNLAYHG
jgi:hypothetical protein